MQPAFLSGQVAGEPPVRILGYLEGGHQFAGGTAAEHAEQPCDGPRAPWGRVRRLRCPPGAQRGRPCGR
jgi:hypothetical protein